MKGCSMKRSIDVLLSLLALITFLPFALIIILILKFTGEGVFYSQPRVGLRGDLFNVYKFVTMKRNSEYMGARDITLKNDPRVLPFGKFLRKTKLNEVPQLINVLKGEMSIVGPRPHTPKTFEYYPEYERSIISAVKPGLTGLGSIFFRDEEAIIANSSKDYLECYMEDIQPRKAQLEMWYAKNRSFWLDIKIIFSTILVVIFPGTKLHFKLIDSVQVLKDSIGFDQI